MPDLPLIVLLAACYWLVSRAARIASLVFRLILAAALALLLLHRAW